jgi:peptide/nickel transport system ATP-binding protein
VSLLVLDELSVALRRRGRTLQPVAGVSLSVAPGEVLGIVGESGCGKTLTLLALLGLLPPGGKAGGSARFRDRELVGLGADSLRRLRGADVGMVFQDPMSALNPYLTLGRQVGEALEVHRGLSRRAARDAAAALLASVHFPAPERALDAFPHQFSGGLRQRATLAMALACDPPLLLADEPTTALDVTVQAQILALFREIRERAGTAIVLVTHDLGVVASICDRVAVMYAGRVVECADVDALFATPLHPYTRGLLAAVPGPRGLPAQGIPGAPPDPGALPPACAFEPRCAWRMPVCAAQRPPLTERGEGRQAACHLDAPP